MNYDNPNYQRWRNNVEEFELAFSKGTIVEFEARHCEKVKDFHGDPNIIESKDEDGWFLWTSETIVGTVVSSNYNIRRIYIRHKEPCWKGHHTHSVPLSKIIRIIAPYPPEVKAIVDGENKVLSDKIYRF